MTQPSAVRRQTFAPGARRPVLATQYSALACMLLLSIGAAAQGQEIVGDVVVLRGATLIDGTGAEPCPSAIILMQGDRIHQVVCRRQVDGEKHPEVPEHAAVLDLSGRWVVPGFIDTHAHMPPVAEQADVLATLLAFGITTARSPAAAPATGVQLRERLARGELVGPHFLTAGRLMDGPESVWDSFATIVTSPEEARAVVRSQAELGVDFIKLYVELSPDIVGAAIEEAHGLGKPVIGHLGRTRWQEAVELGIDTLTHSSFLGLATSVVPDPLYGEFKEFFMPNRAFDPGLFEDWRRVVDLHGPEMRRLTDLMKNGQVTLDPTLTLGEAVTWGDDPSVLERLEPRFATERERAQWIGRRHPYSARWSEAELAEAKRTWPLFLEAIRILHEEGVVIMAGSDLQNPWMTPGVSLHREFQLLAQAGIPNLEVIGIGTRNGARALGILGETGTIEAGKRADLVVLTADPVLDIRNTRQIERIFLAGREFTPDSLLARRE